MPSFRYQGLASNGQSVVGVVAAPDRASAVRLLSGRGETPLAIDAVESEEHATDTAPSRGPSRPAADRSSSGAPAGSSTGPSRSASRGARQAAVGTSGKHPTVSRTELASLMRELATAVEAGLPLMAALRTVQRQVTGKGMPVIVAFLIERVEAGTPLHQAAREYGPPFDDMVVGMLRAADASGKMSEVLHQLSDLLERQVELRNEVIGATIYPLIVAGLIGASIVVLVTFVLPRLMAPLIAQLGQRAGELPLPTRVLLGTADFVQHRWPYLLAAIAVAILSWRAWIRVPANKLRFHTFILRMPIVGRLIRDVAVARFTRTLGTLVSAGLPILAALRIVRDTLGNVALMNAVDQVQEKVTTGQSLAEPLERSGLFPPLLVQIVNIGERSGRLETMLLHAATAFDRRVNTSLKTFAKALPPILLVIMATIAAFVLSGIILPLVQLQKAISV
ncbi:MAG: type II secretion system F family protein [Phycisphaerales bacterium]